MNEPIEGCRVATSIDLTLRLQSGDYGVMLQDGQWYARAPTDPSIKLVANLSGHTVTEHADGTITVSPSIEVSNHQGRWHGFLERGIWRED